MENGSPQLHQSLLSINHGGLVMIIRTRLDVDEQIKLHVDVFKKSIVWMKNIHNDEYDDWVSKFKDHISRFMEDCYDRR